MTVSFKVVNREPVPATVLDTDLPAGLDYIIARAMAKDPAQRYQRGMEMVLDVQDLQAGRELSSKSKQPGSSLSADAEQTANARARSWATGQPAVAARPHLSMRTLPGREWRAEKLLRKIGEEFFRRRHRAPARAAPFWIPVERYRLVPETTLQESVRDRRSYNPVTGEHTGRACYEVVTGERTGLGCGGGHAGAYQTGEGSCSNAGHRSGAQFHLAQLSVWVDDHKAYNHLLEGSDKKRLVVFHGVQGHESHALQLAPGKHRVRVEVASGLDSYDQSGTVQSQFVSGKEKVLRIHFNKHREMTLSLQ